MDRIASITDFLKEIEKFKHIEREVYYKNGRKESDAEHVWHLLMMLILFEKELPADLDFKKMIKLALIHDLPEIYAGDTFFFDPNKNAGVKHDKEVIALEKLTEILPDDLKKEFRELFDEYEKGESKEVKFVASFDKIQPLIQNFCGEGKGWKINRITGEKVDSMKKGLMQHDDFVRGVYEKLMDDNRKKGFFYGEKDG